METSDVIGIIGTTLMLGAFVLNIAHKLDSKSPFYMGLNFVGGIFACIAACMIQYEPFIILEGTWGLISGFALILILKQNFMAKEQKILIDWPTGNYVVGLDEVGRGCGAGPVVTAAVILPKGFQSPLIRDSKKLTENQRKEAYKIIMENAISIVCHAGPVKDIDELGIDKATFKTMHKCLDELSVKPDYILVDGTSWDPYMGPNGDNSTVNKIPKGDDTYTCIAAAAIIAKVRRDEYMVKLHQVHPEYGWDSNKGYLSQQHIAAIREHGVNRYHRTLFVKNFVN